MRSETRPLLIMLLLLASVPALVHVIDPPARDQGVFALIAWRWSAGDVPYVSAGLEHKGPLPFLGYRLGFLLFGNEMRSARLAAYLSLLLAGFLTAAFGGRLVTKSNRASPAGTGLAGVIYLLIIGAGGLSAYWSGAQAEAFMEPFTLLSAILFASSIEANRSSNLSLRRVVLSGICLGMASLGKPTALFMLPALAFAWPGAGERIGGRRRAVLALVAGVLVPWGVSVVYFAARGALHEYLDAVFLMNVSYGGRGFSLLPKMLEPFVFSHHVVVNGWFLVPAAVGVIFLWSRRHEAIVKLLFGWTLMAYAQVLVQGRMFGYHYYPVVAPVSLLMTVGLHESFRGARTPASRVRGRAHGLLTWGATLVSLAAVLLGILGLPWIETEICFRRLTGRISETAFLSHFSPGGKRSDVDPVETMNAARFAERFLKPEETLLVWGFEPAVNYLARRRCPTRFIYDQFLTSPAVPPAEREKNWRLFWQDLGKTPPDWIAVVRNDKNPVESKDSAGQLEESPELKKYLLENYLPEAQIGDFEFFRRNPPPTGDR